MKFDDLSAEQRMAARFIADMFREWKAQQQGDATDGDDDGKERSGA